MIQRFQSCLLAVLLFISSQLIAQQISNLGSYDGIDNGAVRTFAKDSMGYMWIGTSMGLSRFSGYSFKSYKFSEHNEGIVDLLSDLNGFYALESLVIF